LGGGRRYSSYSFLTSALDGGEWSASRPGRALPPGKGPHVPIIQEAGWAPEPVWTQGLEEKSSAPVGDRTPIVQLVVRHYTTRKNKRRLWLDCVEIRFVLFWLVPYPSYNKTLKLILNKLQTYIFNF
jgi:hypothetical protein